MSQVRPSFFPIWAPAASRRRPGLTYVLLMIPMAGFQRWPSQKLREIRTADRPDLVVLYGRS